MKICVKNLSFQQVKEEFSNQLGLFALVISSSFLLLALLSLINTL